MEYKCLKMENKYNILNDQTYLLHILNSIRKVTGLGNNVMLKDLPKEIDRMIRRTQFKKNILQKDLKKLKRKIFDSENPS
jgi:hypothetical protein